MKKYKIVKLRPVAAHNRGKITLSNPDIEPHEKGTIIHLTKYGFDIEAKINVLL